tara:strand:+ start:4285 stop:4587 length:303 start_codon:yes stop_codon:yes gene_type:complete
MQDENYDPDAAAAIFFANMKAMLGDGGAQPVLEIVAVWVSVFAIIEFVNRFRLGKIRWNGGSALDKIVGFSTVLTGAPICRYTMTTVYWMSTVHLIKMNG